MPILDTITDPMPVTGVDGLMFDLIIDRDLTISKFEIVSLNYTIVDTVKIYYRPGGHAGYEEDEDAWTHHGDFNLYLDDGEPSPIEITPLHLTEGTWGVYLYLVGTFHKQRAEIGTAEFSSEGMTMFTGTGTDDLFLWPWPDPYIWYGRIHYDFGYGCDIETCKDAIEDKILAIVPDAQSALAQSNANAAPLLRTVNGDPGEFVTTPGGELPALAELVNRVHNLGGGFSSWSFTETGAPGRTAINLPDSIANPAKAAVEINGVRMTQGSDYSIAAAVLTLTHGLEPGDQITVTTYGDG